MSGDADLTTRIQRTYANLRPSEQVVADHLGTMAGQRLNHSITSLAKITGVSEATISRVSRALGFNGYTDLKLSMAAASTGERGYPNIPSDLRWTDPLSDVSRKLAVVLSSSISETERLLDTALLDQAIDAILNADKVVFMGVGGAAAICQEAAHVMLKIGIDTVCYSDGYTQTIVASNLKPTSLLVAVSHTGTTPTVVKAAAMARSNGVQTIAIIGDATSALAQAADLVFVTSQTAEASIPLHGDFLEGRISQLYLIDVLYIGVMFRLGDAARAKLAATTRSLTDQYSKLPSTKKTLSRSPGKAAARSREKIFSKRA